MENGKGRWLQDAACEEPLPDSGHDAVAEMPLPGGEQLRSGPLCLQAREQVQGGDVVVLASGEDHPVGPAQRFAVFRRNETEVTLDERVLDSALPQFVAEGGACGGNPDGVFDVDNGLHERDEPKITF